MRIVVVSCWKYRDCWKPWFQLLEKFWPQCPHEVYLVTDVPEDRSFDYGAFNQNQVMYVSKETQWTRILGEFSGRYHDQPLLIFQEDFWINATVNELLIEKGLQQLQERKAAMVRIYPCPGGDIPYGDKWYAEIPKGTRYRVSCMASIWNPRILAEIASKCGETPFDFEITGSKLSNDFDEPFLAFRRDVQPWPINFYASAISRGKWEPAALAFCNANGIEVDLSMREVA